MLHKVQKAWIEHDVPQCGYCQSGMIMAVADLLKNKPKPTDADIDADHHQYLPLRHLPAGARGHPRRRQRVREAAMNYVPKMNRRSFIVTAAAAGGGLALGLDIPLGGPQPILAQDGSPEVNAWVVIRPDDTVVIRVARAEMGQGSLTGLAQLVAEELDCDWSKVTWETPTPGQNLARKRAWGDYATVGSRAIRQSQEYVRKGGATAREMLKQAAANEWKVPVSEVTAAAGVITHNASGRKTTYGKVAEAAAKLEPPTEVKLKDPKDWKIAGKPLKRLDTADKVNGQAGLLDGRQAARHAQRRDQGEPGVRRQAEELRRRQGHRHEGREEGRAERRFRGRGDRRYLVAGQDRARGAADRLGRGSERQGLERDHRRDAQGRPRRPGGIRRQSAGRRQSRHRRAAKKVEAVYAYPFQNHAAMEPMNATARYTADKCEVWTSSQNGEAALAAAREASGLPVEKCDVYNTILGGGFGRRARSEYVSHAVRHRQGDAGHADQADQVA